MKKQETPMGMYIHIPFCSKKCDYCDFVSYSMDKKAQQQYLDALCTEIEMLKEKFQNRTFNSIYIGGGTPSIVYEGFIAGLARKLYSSFHFLEGTEFTIEINPASFTKEKFFEYVQAGVNRISVGVQCLDSKLLRTHGRIQSLENIKECFEILKNSEFPNVNGDIMIGLPGQTKSSVVDTVKFLIKHKVKHISTYGLQIEKGTLTFDKLRRGRFKAVPDEVTASLYEKINKLLEKNGYRRYEVSNFAKPGFESVHNQKYWDETNYLGLGVSAHSYIDGYRYNNTKRLDTYIDAMEQGKSAVYSKEYISINERRTERIMLGLRTVKGINLSRFKDDFDEDLLESRAEQIGKFESLGMLEVKDGHLFVTAPHFYLSNSIIVELI